MKHRYLVTGAQGFIGRYFVSHLLDRFPQSAVLGIGRSPGQNSTFRHSVTCGDRAVIAPLPERLRNVDTDRYAYVACELSSAKFGQLVRDFQPTAVIHLAATLRGISEELAFQNNVGGTETLLAALRETGLNIRLLLLASSGGVYGRQESLPIAEAATVQPIDLYSRGKLASEDLARSFAIETRVTTAIARIFNVFGPGQDELHFAGRMAGQIAAILAGRSTPVIRTGPLVCTRDFLDVRDVCLALGTILEGNLEGVCNVASGVETNVDNLLQVLLQVAGLETTVEIEELIGRTDPIPRHFANINRLTEAGFGPQHSIAHTTRDMLNYYSRLIYTRRPFVQIE